MLAAMMRTTLILVALVGCSGSQGNRSDIPVAARPLWDQCHSSVEAWCHTRGQGDLTLERECEGNVGHEYAAIADEAARRQFLSAHGCTL